MELNNKKALAEAKLAFKEMLGRKPNLKDEKDLTTLSTLQLGILRGYEMAYHKFYTPMCDNCGYRSATCFGPGSYCDECSLDIGDNDDEEK